MKKTKWISALLVLVCLAATCALVGCEDGKTDATTHEHKYAATWEKDDTHHWHACTVDGCTEKSDYAVHDTAGVGGVCSKCGYKATVTPPTHDHNYDTTSWEHSDTHHWHACTMDGCDSKGDYAAHTWDDGVVTKAATCTEAGVKTYTCTACKTTKTEPIAVDADAHTWKTTYTADGANGHYQECMHNAAHHSATEAHDTAGTDGACSKCGYKPEHTHTWDTQTWHADETNHWHACRDSACTEKKDFATHNTNGDLGGCSICKRIPDPDAYVGEDPAEVQVGGGKSARISTQLRMAMGDDYKFTYTGTGTVTVQYLYNVQGQGAVKDSVTLENNGTFTLTLHGNVNMLITSDSATEFTATIAMEYVEPPAPEYPTMELDTAVTVTNVDMWAPPIYSIDLAAGTYNIYVNDAKLAELNMGTDVAIGAEFDQNGELIVLDFADGNIVVTEAATYYLAAYVDCTFKISAAAIATHTVEVADTTNGTVTVTDASGAEKTTFTAGDRVTVTASPANGYSVGTFKVNNQDVTHTNGVYTFTIGEDSYVAVTFVAATYTVTVGELQNGAVTVATQADVEQTTFDAGASVKITVTPDTGYEVDTFTVGGIDHKGDLVNGVYSFTIEADTAVAVTFKAVYYTITVNDPENGTVEITGTKNADGKFLKGSEVTITATPNEHYETKMVVDGSTKWRDEFKFTIDKDTTVTIEFKRKIKYCYFNRYVDKISGSDTANGGTITVTDETGKEYSKSSGSYDLPEGATVTITPHPAAHYRLSAIQLRGGTYGNYTWTDVASEDGTYTFVVADNTYVSIIFATIKHTATAATAENGTVSFSSTTVVGTKEIKDGDWEWVYFKPDKGYLLGTVSVDGTEINMSDVTDNKYKLYANAPTTISATFVETFYTVTVTGETNGTVTVTDEDETTKASYRRNNIVKLTVAPADGYAVESFKVNDVAVDLVDGAYTFEILKDTTVTVKFVDVASLPTTADLKAALDPIKTSAYIVVSSNGYSYIVNDTMNAKFSSSNPTYLSGGYYFYDGYVRYIYSGYSSSVTLRDNTYADTFPMYASIASMRAPFFTDSDYELFKYTSNGVFKLIDDNANANRLIAALADIYIITLDTKNYTYSDLAVKLNEDGTVTISYKETGSSVKTCEFTYTTGEEATTTASTMTEWFNGLTPTKNSVLEAFQGTFVNVYDNDLDNAAKKEIVIAYSGITFDGTAAVITELPTWRGGGTSNSGANCKDNTAKFTVEGKEYTLKFMSPTEITVQASDETEAVTYMVGGIPATRQLPEEFYGTWSGTLYPDSDSQKRAITLKISANGMSATFNGEDANPVLVTYNSASEYVRITFTHTGGVTTYDFTLDVSDANNPKLDVWNNRDTDSDPLNWSLALVSYVQMIAGTYSATERDYITYQTLTYTLTITDSKTANFEISYYGTVQEGGDATAIEYNHDTKKLVLTIDGDTYTFTVNWNSDESAATSIKYDYKSVTMNKQ